MEIQEEVHLRKILVMIFHTIIFKCLLSERGNILYLPMLAQLWVTAHSGKTGRRTSCLESKTAAHLLGIFLTKTTPKILNQQRELRDTNTAHLL